MKQHILLGLFLLGVLLLPDAALASTGGSGALPYESWLDTLRQSITGPFAFTASIIGIVAAGATLIFGGDLNGFFRSMIFLVMTIALIIAANNLMSSFFGKSALVVLEDAADVVAAWGN